MRLLKTPRVPVLGLSLLTLLSGCQVTGITSAEAQPVYNSGRSARPVQFNLYIDTFPTLVQVQGYPVYVAADVDANYFYFGGLFWVFADGQWWESSAYNGPWNWVEPDAVPLDLLQVPVQYYRSRPQYFEQWNTYEAPSWPIIFGELWFARHRDWDRHDHRWGERDHDRDGRDEDHGHSRQSDQVTQTSQPTQPDRRPQAWGHPVAEPSAPVTNDNNYPRYDYRSPNSHPRPAEDSSYRNNGATDNTARPRDPVTPEHRFPMDRPMAEPSQGGQPRTSEHPVSQPRPVAAPAPAATNPPPPAPSKPAERKHNPEERDK
jgi:hypothetical protein